MKEISDVCPTSGTIAGEIPYIVLYDGLCGLCNRSVQFLLKIDHHSNLRYAPLQGETAAALFNRRPEVDSGLTSVIFVVNYGGDNEKVYFRSDSVLQILRVIGGVWRPVSWLRIIPRPFRDLLYKLIATNRYRWFARYETCFLPEPRVKNLFLN